MKMRTSRPVLLGGAGVESARYGAVQGRGEVELRRFNAGKKNVWGGVRSLERGKEALHVGGGKGMTRRRTGWANTLRRS